jgi:radical SAM protein with 4Fe4S-binding SPASM domain
MTKRKLQKALQRLKNLPGGYNLFLYSKNKLYSFILRKIKSCKVAYPSNIMLEVTNKCNLRCVTCARGYKYGTEMSQGSMDFDSLKKIIDECYPYLDSIGLTGLGETFLYNHIVEAVDYIKNKNKGIIISCSINAHLKNSAEIAGKLINKVDTIQISIDGIGDVYNKVRINADYDFFIDKVKQISELSRNSTTDLMFNMVVLKDNFHQMSEIVNLANDLDIKYLNVVPMNLVSITDIDKSYYEFYGSKEFKREFERAKQTAQKYPSFEFTSYDFNARSHFHNCRFVWNYFYISWDGFLPPCCAKPFPKELNFGNVFENGLLTSLNSLKYQEFRKLWYQDRSPQFCNNCFHTDLNPNS